MKKIPDTAKLVFKGVMFDVYQWEQEVFDGTTQIYEALKRANTLQAICTKGENILLAEEEQPHKGKFISLLGGRQEENETPEEGIKRELLEEAGLAPKEIVLFKDYNLLTKIDWDWMVFLAKDCEQVAEPRLDPGEKITLREVTFDELFDVVETPEFRGREIQNDLYRIKQNPKDLEAFKQLLFN